jgi:hypothetical protein
VGDGSSGANAGNSIGMPDYVLDAVRSMQGVAYAVPLYSSTALVKLGDGSYQAASVVGLGDTSLFGRPEMVNGKITDIYGENGFNMERRAVERSNPRSIHSSGHLGSANVHPALLHGIS